MVCKTSDIQLDHPDRYDELKSLIENKKFLKKFYEEVYYKYLHCLNQCPNEGVCIELGSGGGFAKKIVPELVTTDIIAYPGVEMVVDGTAMPFADNSLRGIFMFNVFHHISRVENFLSEANRCLMIGGRVFLVEPHPGLIGYPIYRWLHHEPFEMSAKEWHFQSKGPLSDANGALPWIVFHRDRQKFAEKFKTLKILQYSPHSPLRYWLAGGLKTWSLVPSQLFNFFTNFDQILSSICKNFGSFVDIELVKIKG